MISNTRVPGSKLMLVRRADQPHSANPQSRSKTRIQGSGLDLCKVGVLRKTVFPSQVPEEDRGRFGQNRPPGGPSGPGGRVLSVLTGSSRVPISKDRAAPIHPNPPSPGQFPAPPFLLGEGLVWELTSPRLPFERTGVITNRNS